jgi:hypothetical protein
VARVVAADMGTRPSMHQAQPATDGTLPPGEGYGRRVCAL